MYWEIMFYRETSEMKFVLCDDHRPFMQELLDALEHYCSIKDWTFTHRCYHSTAHMLAADLSDVQVVFLDVDMPEINGIEAARTLRARYPDIIIVFVTAYIEYAPAGYSVEAFRYLLKQNYREMLPDCLDAVWEKLYVGNQSLSILHRGQPMQIRLRDILYFEGTAQRHVLIHTSISAEALEIAGRLADYEKQMKDKGFLRIQKSYLVNMFHIRSLRNYKAILSDGQSLKVSQQNYAEVRKTYVLWKGRQL